MRRCASLMRAPRCLYLGPEPRFVYVEMQAPESPC